MHFIHGDLDHLYNVRKQQPLQAGSETSGVLALC